jgi:predicted flap endonuclease-1-like 5' DNA nuclease/cell division protein FtsB
MFQQDITTGPGTGTFASHTFEILIMLLGAFLLGLWFGWVLWNKYKQAFDKLRLENDGLQASIATLNADLGALKTRVGAFDKERDDLAARLAFSDKENVDLRIKLAALQTDIAELVTENRQLETEVSLHTGETATIDLNANAAPIITEIEPAPTPDLASITEDDTLLDTETSGNELVIDLSVDTAADDLTEAPVAAFEAEITTPSTDEIVVANDQETVIIAPMNSLDAADVPEPVMTYDDEHFRFVMQAPEEVEQSSVARSLSAPLEYEPFSDASYEALSRSIVAPDGGDVIPHTDDDTDTTAAVSAFVPLKQDDLKIVEGIGPKIEELLFKAGIHTYSELAAAPVSRLKEILAEAGPRFSMHDPGTWSAQSLLAANGEWENLKAYQGFLDSGKAPSKK